MNDWRAAFDERQNKLINDCIRYVGGDAAGLPGHNLMVIIAQMAHLLDLDNASELRQPASETVTHDGSTAGKRA